jgi:hypothetical protein
MPIILIIYALAAASCFGSGYYVAFNHEHKSVIELQSSIDYANKIDQKKLAEIVATVKENEQTQLNTIKQLEIDHEKVTTDNDTLSAQLAAVQLHIRSVNQSRGGCSVSKNSDTSVNKIDGRARQDVPADGFSEKLDRLIQEKSALADKSDADKHFLLRWIDSIPNELKK